MSSPYELTATELVQLVTRREISVGEIVESAIRRIEAVEPHVRAWTWFDAELARSNAAVADLHRARGDAPHRPLCGALVGVKDVFNTCDMPTQMGSALWAGFQPGNDARVVFNVRYDGAIIAGKTQTSEFAVHHPTAVRNPRDVRHASGTSSAGSAAAVAAGMVPVALGTQTAGSCIRPASYCGIYGFKPTFGTVPRTGVLKTSDTLDTIGWFARSIDDIELLFESVRVRGRNYPLVEAKVARRPLSTPLRIGVFRGPHWSEHTPDAQRVLLDAADRLQGSGEFVVDEIVLPEAQEIYDSHELIYCKALSYYFRGETRQDRSQISAIMLDMLERGESITAEEYHHACARQAELTHQMDSRFRHDAWLTLSAAGEAPRGLSAPDPADTCKIWTYLGLPTLSVPAAVGAAALPIGLQVVAPKYADYRVLDVARHIAEVLDVRVDIANPLAGAD